jgi:hypothetical protein
MSLLGPIAASAALAPVYHVTGPPSSFMPGRPVCVAFRNYTGTARLSYLFRTKCQKLAHNVSPGLGFCVRNCRVSPGIASDPFLGVFVGIWLLDCLALWLCPRPALTLVF